MSTSADPFAKRKKTNDDPWKELLMGSKGMGKSYTAMKQNLGSLSDSNAPWDYLRKKPKRTIKRKRKDSSSSENILGMGITGFDRIPQSASSKTPDQNYLTRIPPQSNGYYNYQTDRNTGHGQPYSPYNSPYTPNQNPWYQPQPREWKWTTGTSTGSSEIEKDKKKEPEKPKYTQEELKGKLIAYATVKVNGNEHTGVLFVRKCGAWKLIEAKTMSKVASGGAGSQPPDVIIHYVIFSQFEEKDKKKGRFDDIDMVDKEESNGEGSPGISESL